MKIFLRNILCTVTFLVSSQLTAADMLMVRSEQSFPETMLALQSAIKAQGYTVSRVQRVDIGLTKSGFKTDKYRVVFFGKVEEVNRLTKKYPELIPYLPLKLAIFAEENETLIVGLSPHLYADTKNKPELEATLKRWTSDITAILDTTMSK